MILLKSKLLAHQIRTVIRDNITTVINEQQLKRTQEVCTQYCDEWRKVTSVIQSFSHSVIVLTPGGGGGASQILLMCETL